MIGKYQIQLGADQFVSGMSSSDFATDGALGTESHDTNPFLLPGALSATTIPTDSSTNLADNIIVTSEDPINNGNRLAVGDAAKYYTISTSNVVTNVATGSDTTHYTRGHTDIAIQSVAGGGVAAFVTHGTDIAYWNGGSTLSESWWSSVAYYTGTTHPPALTANPHPLLTYNTNLWVGDGSQLHNIIPNVASTSSTIAVNINVLSLDLYSTIYALGIDPSTGLMMVSFSTLAPPATGGGDAISAQYFVGLYDGYSTGLRRKIPVDDLVTSFQNVGGTVYVGYGRRLGVWNGNGITFLRQLKNVTLNSIPLMPYKHHICNIANILLVVDGPSVLAYGDVVAGKKGFFYIVNNYISGTLTNIGALFPVGNNQLGIACSTNKFSYVDLTSTANNSNFVLYFNNIYFPRPVFIRRMRVITNGLLTNAHIIGNIQNEKGTFIPIASANSARQATATTYTFDFDFTSAEVLAIQPVIQLEEASSALVRVIVYYDVAQ